MIPIKPTVTIAYQGTRITNETTESLIQAAPYLLEALRNILLALEGVPGEVAQGYIDDAKDAIHIAETGHNHA